MIEIADKWTQLPQRPVPLDRSNKLARGLVFAHTPVSGPFETVFNDQRGAFGSGVSIAPSRRATNGIAFTGGQATGSCSWGATWDRLAGATSVTIAALLRPGSISSGTFLAKWGGGSNLLLGALVGSGNVAFIAGNITNDRNGVQTSGGTLEVGKSSLVVWAWGGPLVNSVYIDGVPMSLSAYADASPTSVTAIGSSTSASVMQLGIASDGGAYTGSVDGCWMWSRALQQSEIQAFTRNPGQLYRKRAKQVYVALASSSAVFNPMSGRGGAAAHPLAIH